MGHVLLKRSSLPLSVQLPRLSKCCIRTTRSCNPSITRRQMASATPKLSVSAGSDEKVITDALTLKLLPPQSRWQVTPAGEGIQRTFKFKTFKAAWSFMDRVAGECKTARHHPEWSNIYNTVFVRWTTHQPKGLSEKDVTMAMFCDEHARELGVLEEDAAPTEAGEGPQGLADGLAKSAGDCCVPKKL